MSSINNKSKGIGLAVPILLEGTVAEAVVEVLNLRYNQAYTIL